MVPATPTPPAVPEVASGGAADVAQCAAEQSFAELGLGSYTPVGLIQNLLEFMHVDLGLPWWGAIATCKSASRGGQKEWGQNLNNGSCQWVRNRCRQQKVRKADNSTFTS